MKASHLNVLSTIGLNKDKSGLFFYDELGHKVYPHLPSNTIQRLIYDLSDGVAPDYIPESAYEDLEDVFGIKLDEEGHSFFYDYGTGKMELTGLDHHELNRFLTPERWHGYSDSILDKLEVLRDSDLKVVTRILYIVKQRWHLPSAELERVLTSKGEVRVDVYDKWSILKQTVKVVIDTLVELGEQYHSHGSFDNTNKGGLGKLGYKERVEPPNEKSWAEVMEVVKHYYFPNSPK